MILIKMSLLCNLACDYCYQWPIKPKEEQDIDYDAVEQKIREVHTETGSKIVLHGGEPLYQDKRVIERFLKLSHELSGCGSIQTNGTLIDEELIDMFKRYKVGVGVSIDGPWPLNELRGRGTKQERKQQTALALKNIDRLLDAEVPTSIIAVIHKKNATGDRIETMKQWVLNLHKKRISGRLNPLCSTDPELELTPMEAVHFYNEMFDFMMEHDITGWSPFRDMINAVVGDSNVVCVFRPCDPYFTPSATSILKDGSVGVCLRLYQDDGKMYRRLDKFNDIRSKILSQTDCKDCIYWKLCYGGCTGMAENFDWRNKDRYCEMYRSLFSRIVHMAQFMGTGIADSRQDDETDVSLKDGWDGIEHNDKGIRHVDSDARKRPRASRGPPTRHSDSHLDREHGDHMDAKGSHSDSHQDMHQNTFRHADSDRRHEDSGPRRRG